MFQPLRLFLVASEQSDGESPSVVSTGSSLFQVKICCKDVGCVSYHASANLHVWVKDEQNCHFGHFLRLNLLLVHILCVCMVATLRGGGGGGEHSLLYLLNYHQPQNNI